jgi:hypothetical protein
VDLSLAVLNDDEPAFWPYSPTTVGMALEPVKRLPVRDGDLRRGEMVLIQTDDHFFFSFIFWGLALLPVEGGRWFFKLQ